MVLKYVNKHIMLKSRFIKAVKEGRKRATIRLGRVRVYSPDALIHAGGKIIARAVIKSVRYKKVRDLDDHDATIDGLNSREELIAELKKLYGDINDDDTVTIIEFEVKELLDIPEGEFWITRPPYEIAKLALMNLKLTEQEKHILETLVKTKSIRKTAKSLFGNLQQRWRIRKLLKKCYVELINLGAINSEKNELTSPS